MDSIHLILVDPHPGFCLAAEQMFQDLPHMKIINGYFEDLPEFDCMVSAANSFGLMDGGVDAAIIRFFGDVLMERVQQRILQTYLGEQPIGTCLLVETQHPKHPFIAHTPTMRVPMEIGRTDYVYRAMWAMLLAVHHHNQEGQNPIRVVACPGLGTGVGRMQMNEAARQMSLAYQHYLNPPDRIDWNYAAQRQVRIRRGGDYWLKEASTT